MAGGLAGGLLGSKKKNHGILGTVGGAIVGSLVQDNLKKHSNKPHGSHGSNPLGSMGGSIFGKK